MMYANPYFDWTGWDYLQGNLDMSIATQRYYHLMELNHLSENSMKLAVKDKDDRDKWTQWKTWYGGFSFEELRNAYDVHRSVLPCEIVIESDYPTYEENYDAVKLIGAILEKEGFQPLYYYSGNKSVHIHVYFSFKCLLNINMALQERIINEHRYKSTFVKQFMAYLRMKMITCWDLGLRKFDTDMANPKHLIRSEMSRNKLGYKTFLGYTWKDVSFVPYICNEENRIYPRIGGLRMSEPNDPEGLVLDYFAKRDAERKRGKVKRRESSLMKWINPKKPGVQDCVNFILGDDFRAVGDGYQRAMFILINELKAEMDPGEVLQAVLEWNQRMGAPVRDQEIQYRVKMNKVYTLGCDYVHEFLKTLGYSQVGEKCNRKI